jgi:hypothetical protein
MPPRDSRAIREAVGQIRSSGRTVGSAGWDDRRSSRRIRVQRPVYLTPVLVDAGPIRLPKGLVSLIAYTTDMSQHGIGLLVERPLETRHALVTFQVCEQKLISLLIELKWSRRRADRRFSSGGTIITVIETPPVLRELARQKPLPALVEPPTTPGAQHADSQSADP